MNYLDIILKGYFDANNREYLTNYFTREFKKAEKENYTPMEFFNGCLKVLKYWESDLSRQIHERKRELYLWLNEAENNTLTYHDLESKTIEQKRIESIEFCKNELANVRPDGIGSESYTINLITLTNGQILHHLYYEELVYIYKSFNEAKLNIALQKNGISLNDEYNDMYVVSETKKYFYDSNKVAIQYNSKNNKESFELTNCNIYDIETGELIIKGTQNNYNSEFLIDLYHLESMKVEDFLDYQYNNSSKPKLVFKYVKICALNSESIKSQSKIEAIKEWVNKIEKSTTDADKTDNETSSNEVVKDEFKDFFINTKIDIIDNIQKEFKQASQTELAMLIIILTEYKLVDIIANSKTKSRKHFIHSLTDNKRLRLTHIDNTIKKGKLDAKGNIINDRYSFVKVKLDKILCNVN